jgi:membrane associated rhomboid family serine protease
MIPIRDDQPRFSVPYLTYFLIGLNLLIFFFEAALDPRSLEILIRQFGLIPAHVTHLLGGEAGTNPAASLLPILTSMFLHGSWLHVIGNMWFLWIFGDNIEDYLGHFQYLMFYLISGVAAALAQLALTPGSRVPTVGASGAIAGVLGAYFILYPKAHVLNWFPPVFFFHLPAWVMLGYWFLMQFLSGAATQIAYSTNMNRGGVAFWAHVGGFVAGMVMIKVFPERPQRNRYGTW